MDADDVVDAAAVVAVAHSHSNLFHVARQIFVPSVP
jgi:hypothetical protein